MRVLITGASGLVGRNITEALAGEHELLTPSQAALDLQDKRAVLAYLDTESPELVIHCAGLVGGIQANIADPVAFLVDNTEMGFNVIRSAMTVGVPNLINMGSSCMYPRAAPNPLREEQILDGALEPTNEGYAIAKAACQRLCCYINRVRPGCHYKTLVPCNLYGRYDKFDPKHSHMIPAAIWKIHRARRENARTVEIWGSGRARREFMYAGDLAHFVRYSIGRLDAMPDTINVGLGRDYSVDEYYEAVAEVMSYSGSFTHDLTKPEGMPQKLVDTTRLRAFGWTAPSSLKDGLARTIDYFLKEYKA